MSQDHEPLSDATATLHKPSTALVLLCLMIGWGLLVAWCIPRVKPPLIFGGLFGLLYGGFHVTVYRWMMGHQPRTSWVLVAVMSAAGTLTTLFLTADRQIPALPPTGNDAIAAALMQSLRDLPTNAAALPDESNLEVSQQPLSGSERIRKYLELRYAKWTGLPYAGWLTIEILLSMLTASLLVWGISLRVRNRAGMEPQP